MAESIKAIETRYDGCHFRSRLKARWAVFFDSLGIRWEYEPQGFKISRTICGDGNGDEPDIVQEAFYLPDFYLTDLGTWVEVKGSLENVSDDYLSMILHAIDWGGQLPGVGDSWGSMRGLLWLGRIPSESVYWVHPPCHVILQHRKGVWVNECRFDWNEDLIVYDSGHYRFEADMDEESYLRENLEVNIYQKTWWYETIESSHSLRAAYRAARFARFEHGETP